MKITILCVGKLKEAFWKDAINEYKMRMSPYAKTTVEEVPDERCPAKASEKDILKVKEIEGEKILKKISADATVFALDRLGINLTSEKFAGKIESLTIAGNSHIIFIIGGSMGLDKKVLQRSNFTISFSKFTFPHQLMRVILIEQIYRAFKIIKKEPYHK